VGFSGLTALHWLIEKNEELVPDPDLTEDDASVSYSHSHGEMSLHSVKSIDTKSGLRVRKLSETHSVRKFADTVSSLANLAQSLSFFLYATKQGGGDFTESQWVFSYLSRTYLESRLGFGWSSQICSQKVVLLSFAT
jgi:hypothetical protein